MALRRSNRRMTFTGSTIFAASTPLVQPTIQENNDHENASPQWISAEEAFGNMKTPKFTKMTRRTTLTRQNVFNDDETIIGGAVTDLEGFKAPRFFIPVSPPGVKTRSRRSSIHMGPPQPVKTKRAGNATGGKKVNSNVGKNDTKVTRKVASKRTSEVLPPVKDQLPVPTKISSRRSVSQKATDGGDAEVTRGERLSPIVNADTKASAKKSRRSLRHQNMESEETVTSSETMDFMHEFQTPRTHLSQVDFQKQKDNENQQKVRTIPSETPKAPISSKTPRKSVSQLTNTPKIVPKRDGSDNTLVVEKTDESVRSRVQTAKISTPRSPPTQSAGIKRQMSEEENNEIERVVKKMFTPAKFYSSEELSYKHKIKSPNTGKTSSSPARTAITRDAAKTGGRKSPARIVLDTSVSQKTPSRAAPKARKILGVSTNSTPHYGKTQSSTKKFVEEKEKVTVDEMLSSPTKSESSFREETENNMTLSHTSHSQWCTIL